MDTVKSLTVTWLAQQPGLGMSIVAGADGLGRCIETVHSTDQRDPTPWMQPGELVLTTGMWLESSDTGEARTYVERLAAAGVAGIGFGVGIHHDRVPVEMVRAADVLGIPILAVPERTPFSHVMTTVWMAKLRAQQQAIRESVLASESLLSAASEGAGPRAIVERMSSALGADVAWIDSSRRIITSSAAAPAEFLQWASDDGRGTGGEGQWITSNDREDQRTLLIPVEIQGSVCASLVVRRAQTFTSADRRVLKTAVALLKVNMIKDREVMEASLDARSVVLNVALSGNFDLAARMGYDIGLDLPGFPMRITAVHGDSGLFELLDNLLTRQTLGRRHFAALHDDRQLVILSDRDSWPGSDLVAQLESVGGVTAASVVAYQSSTFSEAVGRVSATAAAASAVMTDLDTEFNSPSMPLVHDPAHLAWAANLLQPFLDLPERQQADTLRTLHAWLQNHGNNEATARALSVHRNTLRLRMERIRELMGETLDEADTRAGLWMALRTLDLGAEPARAGS
jgi:purine catabolism regulator